MLGREPTLWLAAIRAIIVGAVAFGFKLEPEQVGAIYLVAETVLALINRSQVAPVGEVE